MVGTNIDDMALKAPLNDVGNIGKHNLNVSQSGRILTSARDVSGDAPRQVLLKQPQVLVTGTWIDMRIRCRFSCADSGDQVVGLTVALEPDGVTIQQSQHRFEVAGQDGLIDI